VSWLELLLVLLGLPGGCLLRQSDAGTKAGLYAPLESQPRRRLSGRIGTFTIGSMS
jgi:hypothetical protein